jgi:hypothetical protein
MIENYKLNKKELSYEDHKVQKHYKLKSHNLKTTQRTENNQKSQLVLMETKDQQRLRRSLKTEEQMCSTCSQVSWP